MPHPLVSICIPTYNGEAYLAECLECAIGQTYAPLEILVVDDCSADGTLAIVDSFMRKDDRIRCERNPENLGLVGNWNRCISLSRGEYIKFLFQDDLLATNCVERLVLAARDGVRFTYCARDFAFSASTPASLRDYFEHSKNSISALHAGANVMAPDKFSDAVLKDFARNIVGEPTVTLMHRSLFADYGLFNPDIVQNCDTDFWYRVGTNETVAYVPEPLATFRVHVKSTTAQNGASPKSIFRAGPVDRLLMLHECALNPTFDRLRKYAISLDPPNDLVGMFYDQAHWARQGAEEDASQLQSTEWTPLGELRRMAQRYPAIMKKPPLKYLVARKGRSVRAAWENLKAKLL